MELVSVQRDTLSLPFQRSGIDNSSRKDAAELASP